jgi:hypothetical protein
MEIYLEMNKQKLKDHNLSPNIGILTDYDQKSPHTLSKPHASHP